MIPYRKLQKLCCYGFTAVFIVLVVIFILNSLSYDRIRTQNGLEPKEANLFQNVRHLEEQGLTQNMGNISIKSAINLRVVLNNLHSKITNHQFKFFIYDLPSKFNEELVQCLNNRPGYQSCYDLTNHGMGKILQMEDEYVVTDTNQFSLEVIVHHQLINHPYRTFNMSEADIFYVPGYMGLACFCLTTEDKRYQLMTELYKHLSKLKPFQELRPHFSTLAKIEREQSSNSCPFLRFKQGENITFIAIERETNLRAREYLLTKSYQTIVAPYPSYVHFKSPKVQFPIMEDRKVFLFFAASVRRSNHFRAQLIDQFHNKTTDSYGQFYKNPENKNSQQVMLVTQECLGNHKRTTIPWMRHSVFCLEPPGDSPTRKSFYDAILSGCIPVLFHYKDQDPVHYPFDAYFNYTDFTVILAGAHGGTPYPDVFTTLSQISKEEIQRLQTNLAIVSQYFQYSFFPPRKSTGPNPDAILLILEEIRNLYKINE